MGASDRYIDITTDGPCYLGHPAAAVSAAVSCGVPLEQITLSSDGHGVVPRFDADGNIVGQAVGEVARNHETMVELVRDFSFPLSDALSLITSNASDSLGLTNQGRLETGACANAVLLNQNLQIVAVVSRGQVAMHGDVLGVKEPFSE